MGGGGKIVDVGDEVGEERLNQKTVIMETGANINALTTTYPGQLAFCTATGSGFTIDTLYQRNAANNAWNTFASRVTPLLQESAERTDGSFPSSFVIATVPNTRFYRYFTFPSDSLFHIVTGISWLNYTPQSGNVICGVDSIDSNPPVLAFSEILALGSEVLMTGTGVQRNSLIMSKPIPGGTVCGAWINFTSGGANFRLHAVSPAQKYRKASTTDSGTQTTLTDNTVFSVSDLYETWIKVHYRSYS